MIKRISIAKRIGIGISIRTGIEIKNIGVVLEAKSIARIRRRGNIDTEVVHVHHLIDILEEKPTAKSTNLLATLLLTLLSETTLGDSRFKTQLYKMQVIYCNVF